MATFYELLADVIPGDHSRQSDANSYVTQLMSAEPWPRRVLDFGCGFWTSEYLFRELRPDVHWVGVDVPDSQEARARESGSQVVHFDGERLPFATGCFDLVYSRQVFEHVPHPVPVLTEIKRVLAPGGHFIGSVSQLEPYHSRSVWNFTPYGFRLVLQEAGLRLVEVRPGIDAQSLIRRAYEGRPEHMQEWFRSESPGNAEIEEWARRTGRTPRQANARKLEFAGHFAFKVVRDPDPPPPPEPPRPPGLLRRARRRARALARSSRAPRPR